MYIPFDSFTQLNPAVLLRVGLCGRLADLTTIPSSHRLCSTDQMGVWLYYRRNKNIEDWLLGHTGYTIEIQYLIGIRSPFETFSFPQATL